MKVEKKNDAGRRYSICSSLEIRGWLKVDENYGWELSRGTWGDEAEELSQSRSRENSKGSNKKWRATERL